MKEITTIDQMGTLQNIDLHFRVGFFDRITFTLREDLSFYDLDGNHHKFKAKSTFDGNSVPWLFRVFFPNIDKSTLPSMVHDEDCNEALDYSQRRRGDKRYLELMDDCKVPWWVSRVKYLGVSLMSVWLKIRGKLK